MERSREDADSSGGGADGAPGQGTASGPGAEILRLKARHTEIERRLTELDRHLSLTSDEQVERARLKKEKLWSKDRIAALLSQRAHAS